MTWVNLTAARDNTDSGDELFETWLCHLCVSDTGVRHTLHNVVNAIDEAEIGELLDALEDEFEYRDGLI